MAGVLTQSNSFKLTGMIGRRPSNGELYMAHFMGVGSATKLIANAADNPQASGARLFPNAAAANRPIFYDRDGRARSVSEVYAELDERYAVAANSPATRSAMASLGVTAPVAVASATQFSPPPDNATYLSRLPDVAASRRSRHQSAASRYSVRCFRLATGRSRSLRRFRSCGRVPRWLWLRVLRRPLHLAAGCSRSISSATATANTAVSATNLD